MEIAVTRTDFKLLRQKNAKGFDEIPAKPTINQGLEVPRIDILFHISYYPTPWGAKTLSL